METVSPSAGPIGAALRALRQTQDAGDVTSLGVKCLCAVIAQLAEEGIAPEDLQPLADLAEAPAGSARWEAELDSKAVADWRPGETR
jgi:hypothetical protein